MGDVRSWNFHIHSTSLVELVISLTMMKSNYLQQLALETLEKFMRNPFMYWVRQSITLHLSKTSTIRQDVTASEFIYKIYYHFLTDEIHKSAWRLITCIHQSGHSCILAFFKKIFLQISNRYTFDGMIPEKVVKLYTVLTTPQKLYCRNNLCTKKNDNIVLMKPKPGRTR